MLVPEYADHLRREGAALAVAAERGLDQPVAACPGWDVADLVWHVGEVHRVWRHMIEQRVTEHQRPPPLDRPADADLVPWYREGVTLLADAMEDIPPDTPLWSWSRYQTARFVHRRMPQETAVHRWDAERAVGSPTPIDSALAADGIDEFFDIMTEGAFENAGVALRLVASDAGRSWGVEGEAKPIVMTATASDLLLMLWSRVAVSALSVEGDGDALRAVIAGIDLD